ncbi:MAG: Tellurium resistance, partial [Streptomyces sp.]|nr:Tellurium resistance [Streptomyces sp.]
MPTAEVRLEFRRGTGQGVPRADMCALLLAGGAAPGPADVVGPDAPGHASQAVTHTWESGADGTVLDTLSVDLASLAGAVTAVLVVVRAEGG